MRLIDADKLIDALDDKIIWTNQGWEDVTSVIYEQPTISQWIPVSEGLPEKFEVVIVSVKTGNYEAVTTDYINPSNLEHYWSKHFDDEVIAWMPLPEPYKGNEE